MLEKGRLYSLRKDGTKDSLYLNIKNKRFLFGSAEYCTIRMYIDGIFPEHCVLSIGRQGKAYLKPLHPSALTLVNGIKIKHKVYLQDNDVVTIFIKEFQFAYPPNSLSKNVSFERPTILPYSKQMQPAQKVEMLAPGKNWKTFQPVTEAIVSKVNYIPNKQICIISDDIIKKISEFLLRLALQRPVNIACKKINDQEVNSYSDKFLIKCYKQYFKESPGDRRNLALKLYGFISFLKEFLNRNEDLYVLWPIFESVWKYCIARASEDILFSPIKSLNLKGEVTVYKNAFQSKILSCTSKNVSPVSNIMSEKENQCINNLEVGVLSSGKIDGQKQNRYSSRKISISYKKRVSLAVKRYHLRKRKSTMVAKAVKTFRLSGERLQTEERCKESISGEQGVVLYSEKQQTIVTKRKRLYNKKEKKVLTDKGNSKTSLKQESIEYSAGEQTTITKLTETKTTKRSYKRKKKEAVTNKTALKEEMEQNIISETNDIKSKKRNYEKNKKISQEKTGKSTQECDTLKLSRCQRITRSMAKSRH